MLKGDTLNELNQEVQSTYQKISRRYDWHMKAYSLVGIRIAEYRKYAVDLLKLKPGDRVVDLGCGTGLSFPHIMERIGPKGHLTGVDMTEGMLTCARERCDRAGWHNVELVQSEIGSYVFPEEIDAVISTGVMGYVPEYDHVIQNIAQTLTPGGHLVIVDAKRPDTWPSWLFKLLFKIKKPLGLGIEYFDNRPWESVIHHFQETSLEKRYGGWVYFSIASKSSR
jgi:demethylmenaquinone methyltransferase/2-methoxy-6-polyprenyl-1,4-benzoquinol methylase